MIEIDYEKIKTNILKQKKSILVLKDNAYGFGIENISKIALDCGQEMFAVTTLEDANKIYNISHKAYIIILGPPKYKDDRFLYSVGDMTDYIFCIKNNLSYHLELNISMNRFGFDEINENIVNNHLCEGVYFHSSGKNIKDDLKLFDRMISKIRRDDLIYHVGGSAFIGKCRKYYIRYGEEIYKDALSIKANVLKIRNISKKRVGYNSKRLKNNSLIAIVDIGYNQLLLRVKKDKVLINNKIYKTVGDKCMDYTFISVDKKVNIGDEVRFIDIKHKRINHEIYIEQKRY